MFNDDRLYQNPDLVAENEELSWMTAFWYWKKHVNTRPGVQLGYFGETTDAINGNKKKTLTHFSDSKFPNCMEKFNFKGKLECFKGPNVEKAKLRFILYTKILKGLNINEKPLEKGCY